MPGDEDAVWETPPSIARSTGATLEALAALWAEHASVGCIRDALEPRDLGVVFHTLPRRPDSPSSPGKLVRRSIGEASENPPLDGGETRAYRAVALDTPEADKKVKVLMRAGNGDTGYWVSRAMLLFAAIKPVRLDPREG